MSDSKKLSLLELAVTSTSDGGIRKITADLTSLKKVLVDLQKVQTINLGNILLGSGKIYSSFDKAGKGRGLIKDFKQSLLSGITSAMSDIKKELTGKGIDLSDVVNGGNGGGKSKPPKVKEDKGIKEVVKKIFESKYKELRGFLSNRKAFGAYLFGNKDLFSEMQYASLDAMLKNKNDRGIEKEIERRIKSIASSADPSAKALNEYKKNKTKEAKKSQDEANKAKVRSQNDDLSALIKEMDQRSKLLTNLELLQNKASEHGMRGNATVKVAYNEQMTTLALQLEFQEKKKQLEILKEMQATDKQLEKERVKVSLRQNNADFLKQKAKYEVSRSSASNKSQLVAGIDAWTSSDAAMGYRSLKQQLKEEKDRQKDLDKANKENAEYWLKEAKDKENIQKKRETLRAKIEAEDKKYFNKKKKAQNKQILKELIEQERKSKLEKPENLAGEVYTPRQYGADLFNTIVPPQNIQSMWESVVGTLSTGWSNLVFLLKSGVVAATAVGVAFIGAGMALKGYVADIVMATEKMRGYNISLLGMMKTQTSVDELMKASLNITRNLPVAYDQVFQATKAFSLISPLRSMLSDSQQMEKTLGETWNIVLALSQIEPEWGISGAIFSLREALSGDLLSLKRRFEIPVNLMMTVDGKPLTEVKNNPKKVLEVLNRELSNVIPKSALEMTSNQFGAVLAKMEGIYTQFKAKIGESGIYDAIVDELKKLRDSLTEFMDSGVSDEIAKRISAALVSAFDSAKKLIVGGSRGVADVLGLNINVDSIESSLSGVVSLMEAYVRVFNGVANVVSSKELWDFAKEWFNWISSGAVKAYKIVSGVASGVYGDVQKLTNYSKSLMGSFNESYFSNIMGKIDGITAGKGLFWIWFFGPGNILNLIQSTARTLWVAVSGGFALLQSAIVASGITISGVLTGITTVATGFYTVLTADVGAAIAGVTLSTGGLTLSMAGLEAAIVGVVDAAAVIAVTVAGIAKLGAELFVLYKICGDAYEGYKHLYEYVTESTWENNSIGRFYNQMKEIFGLDTSATYKFETEIPNFINNIKDAIDNLPDKTIAEKLGLNNINPDIGGLAVLQKSLDKNKMSMEELLRVAYPTRTGMVESGSGVLDTFTDDSRFKNSIKAYERVKDAQKIFENHQSEQNRMDYSAGENIKSYDDFRASVGSKVDAVESFVTGMTTKPVKTMTDMVNSLIPSFGSLKGMVDTVTQGYKLQTRVKAGVSMEGYSDETKRSIDLFGRAIAGASGYDALITDGFRPRNANYGAINSKHKDSEAVDYRANPYGRAQLNTFEALKSLEEKAIASGVKKVLLEDSGDFWDSSLVSKMRASKLLSVVNYKNTKSVPHIHTEFGGNIDPQAEGIVGSSMSSYLSSFKKSYDEGYETPFRQPVVDQARERASKIGNLQRDVTMERAKVIDSILTADQAIVRATESGYEKLKEKFKDDWGKFGPEQESAIKQTLESSIRVIDSKFNQLNKEGVSGYSKERRDAIVTDLTEQANSAIQRNRIATLGMFRKNIDVSKEMVYAPGMTQESFNPGGVLGGVSEKALKQSFSLAMVNGELDITKLDTYDNILKKVINDVTLYNKSIEEATDVNKLLRDEEQKIVDTAVKQAQTLSAIIQGYGPDMATAYRDVFVDMNERFSIISKTPLAGVWKNLFPSDIDLEPFNKFLNSFDPVAFEKTAVDFAKKTNLPEVKKNIQDLVGVFTSAVKTSKDNSVFAVYSNQMKSFQQRIDAMDFTKIAEFNDLMNSTSQMNRATRGNLFTKAIGNLEQAPQSPMASFRLGALSAASEFKNWSEMFSDFGKDTVNDLTSTFETGFFDVMSRKIVTLSDFFRSIGSSIVQTIQKIIAKMMAIETTKIILGIDISGGSMTSTGGGLLGALTGASSSGGGFGGLLNMLWSKGGNGTSLTPNALTSNPLLAVAGAAGGIPGAALGSVAGYASKATGWGPLGLFGKNGVGNSLYNKVGGAAGLAAGAALAFLTQPGRLFGGTKDDTAAGREAYQKASESRDEMIKRRITDAEKYMFSNNMSAIAGKGFGTVGYSEWTSGDGWFKGPKEKHSGADTTYFDKSMKEYYQLLKVSAEESYQNQKRLNELKKVNEYDALKQEIEYRKDYLNELHNQYYIAIESGDYKAQDELRDKYYDMKQSIDDLVSQTAEAYKSMIEKVKEIRRSIVTNTVELYSNKFIDPSVMGKATGNASTFGSIFDNIPTDYGTGYAGKFAELTDLLRVNSSGSFKVSYSQSDVNSMMSKFSEFQPFMFDKSYKVNTSSMDEFRASFETVLTDVMDAMKSKITYDNTVGNTNYIYTNMFEKQGQFTESFNDIARLEKLKVALNKEDYLYGGAQAFADANLKIAQYYQEVASQINEWVDEGYLTSSVQKLENLSQSAFEELQKQVSTSKFKSGAYSAFKDYSTFADLSPILDETIKAGGTEFTGLKAQMSTYSDPYEAWFNWSKENITNKMNSAKKGSDEWYKAQQELFDLMAERAEKLTEKSKDSMAKLEELLGNIDETLKIRISEEGKSQKGDIIFMDLRKTEDIAAEIARLAKSNDPKAAELINQLKKKLMGIG